MMAVLEDGAIDEGVLIGHYRIVVGSLALSVIIVLYICNDIFFGLHPVCSLPRLAPGLHQP